ncbi:ABC transporter permease [Agathobacter rectalis]|uniref:ABC transporter permease n=1 Tax=Agathobacter rectalis TaxID=39491 RepID=A0A413ZZB2_9FIRM|nr:ABC transporter permease [Agathobacter rectalis]RHC38327.1 ABC transporter permease [Agathobacter rectalis]
MFGFVINKLKNRKWLNLCLLMGVALFIALFVCHSMFEKGAGNQILDRLFTDHATQQNEFPAQMSREGTYAVADYPDSQSVLDKLSGYEQKWTEYVDINKVSSQQLITLPGGRADTEFGGPNNYFTIGYLPGLSGYADVVKSQTGTATFECCISEKTMDHYGLVAGEKIYLHVPDGSGKKEISFVISQICREKDINNPYWAKTLSDMGDVIFVSQDVFDEMMQYYSEDNISYSDFLMLDYTQINTENASLYDGYMEQFKDADKLYNDNIRDTLERFFTQQKTIKLMLWALELPCLVLLILFIRMISVQILSLEQNDILVLRSRGATKLQVFILYLQQSGIIAFAGCVLGIVLGYIMCRAAASTDGFLRFTAKDISTYKFVWQMLVYAVAAAVIMVLFITVPVWKKSKDAISERSSRGRISKKKPLWEKCFIDVILLALSAYLLYNYNKQKSTLAISVLENRSIDPVMILDNSLFIFAAALLCVRLTGLIILLVDRLFKKHFSPAMYASFLQLKRTRYNQGFLAVFLIMTVAGGIFDANMARTMNSNMEQRIVYNVGCDAIYNEDFRLRIQYNKNGSVNWMYDEPDFGKYESLKNEGICDGVTRVLEDERVDISAGSGSVSDAYLMAINTKEFGETAKLQSDQNDDINDAHWFNYLNELAKEPDGVIISSNLAKDLGLKVGDSLNYSRYVPEAVDEDQIYASENVKVGAIVKGFPGYERYTYETDADKNVTEQEKYLIVANYATVVEKFGMTPYSVWMNLSKGKTVDDIVGYLGGENSENSDSTADNLTDTQSEKVQSEIYRNITSAQQLIDENKNSATVQITNGMFTLSFILSLIVCSVGFLLYWVMTLKQRELQFGIYRAMGMRMREVKAMLLNEQIFLSFLPLLAGAGIGITATAMFVRLISIIYLPQKHNIGVNVYIYPSDMLELTGVLFVAVAVCYVVISRLLKRMKIAQALRLGEDS